MEDDYVAPKDFKKMLKNYVQFDPNNFYQKISDNIDSWFNDDWRRLFLNPSHKKPKLKKISATNLTYAFGLDYKVTSFDSEDDKDSDSWKTLKDLKWNLIKIKQNSAMNHGNANEATGGKLYCYDYQDITFHFGCIQHPKYDFLEAIPDFVSLKYKTAVELKSPFSRDIFTHVPKDEMEQLLKIKKEVNMSGNKFIYQCITNFPDKYLRLMEEHTAYWHQVQLELEVLNLGSEFGIFSQLCIPPAKYCFDNIPKITYSRVDKLNSWADQYIPKIKECWKFINNIQE